MASRDKRSHRTVPVWTFCRLRCDMKHHRQWALTKHRMDFIGLDQGWHTQFLTKFQKLDGFGLLAPMRVCSR